MNEAVVATFVQWVYYLIEYITFGLKLHYLIKVITAQFSAIFLSYMFAYPLSVPIAQEMLFLLGYILLSTLLLLTGVYFVRNMCLRSFDKKFHYKRHILLSILSYLTISTFFVLSGSLLLIIFAMNSEHISTADYALGIFFVTTCFLILSVGYHEQLESLDHPERSKVRQVVHNWLDAAEWATLDDSSLEKEKQQSEFEHQSEQLLDLLSNSKTINGTKLALEFENWLDKYQKHEALGKEIVMLGQQGNPTTNSALQSEHEELIRMRKQLTFIAHIE